jgi:hypothetical protein
MLHVTGILTEADHLHSPAKASTSAAGRAAIAGQGNASWKSASAGGDGRENVVAGAVVWRPACSGCRPDKLADREQAVGHARTPPTRICR